MGERTGHPPGTFSWPTSARPTLTPGPIVPRPALTLNQLNTSDPKRAQEFYSGVSGWRFEPVEGGDMPYWGIYDGDRLNAGMMPLPPEAGMPSHWLVYFGSESVDDDAGRVGELDGTVAVPPMPIPGGRILVAADPQGAVLDASHSQRQ